MAANDFPLKQHLKMSPNSKIKNLVPENLPEIPPEEEWKLGRIWFNTTIGKLQGVFSKLDKETGAPVEPEEWEVRIVGADSLGPTADGEYWPDGLFDFTQETKISDAMDDVNEALKDLAPPEATFLRGDMALVDQEFKTGRISRFDGTTPIEIRTEGTIPGDEVSYIIIDPVVKATLPTEGLTVKGVQQQQFGRADQGIISAVINDESVDEGLDLRALFSEIGRDYADVVQGFDPPITQTVTLVDGSEVQVEANPNKNSYRSSSGMLTVNTVERYNDFKKWQRGTGSVEFTVPPGRHSMHVAHDEIMSGTHLNEEIIRDAFKTNTLEVFYDPDSTAPTTEITSYTLTTGTTKFVSGVEFNNTDITFTLNFVASNAFMYTYWYNPVNITMPGSTLGNFVWNHESSNLNGATSPLWSDQFTLTDFVIEYNSPNTMVESITLTSKAGKPATGWGPIASETIDLLIDTYPVSGNSTQIRETFNDEQYRMRMDNVDSDNVQSVTDNTTGTWDSTLALVTGEAQQYMGTLKKAKEEYSLFGLTTDYTAFADDVQEYYRRFYTNNKPNSNGKIKVKTDGTFGTDFEIKLKLPSLTGWLDVGTLLDIEVFTDNYTVDGTGCGTNHKKTSDGYELSWSAGTLSTVDSGYGYLIKVIIKTNDFTISELAEISGTWS